MIQNKNFVIKLLILTFIIFSCDKNTDEKEYYENGNLKAVHYINNNLKKDSSIFYSQEGKMESFVSYLNNKKSVINYYANGNLKSQGHFLNDTIPIGSWSYFYDDGKLKEVKEFLTINNRPFLNQNWVFNREGDTIKSKSNYYNLLIEKDTIFLNEPVKAKIDLVSPYFKEKNSSIMVVLTKDYSNDFDPDFSNLNSVELDTTFNLNLEADIRKALDLKTDFRKTSIFGRYFNTPGLNKFRGIIVEYYYTEGGIPDSLNQNYYEHKKYFEKEIYIKDTLN